MKDGDICVLIVENVALGKQLILDHFNKSDITYAGLFKAESRDEITKALDAIEE
jgi:hypothetical protein